MTHTQTGVVFSNLLTALTQEQEKRNNEFMLKLTACKTIEEIKANNWLRSYLTPSLLSCNDLKLIKDKLAIKRQKHSQKNIAAHEANLATIADAPTFNSVAISVEWKKSRMWGSNPRCEATVLGVGRYISRSVGGCGYDKESTAIAEALNQSPSILRALYEYKNNVAPNAKNHDVFGYGSGYGILPSLEGGVGVSCYPAIFKKIGYTFKRVASGKTFDVYEITKD